MPTFQTVSGCALPINRLTVVASDFEGEVTTLVGSVAVFEVGSGYGAEPLLVVRSDVPPASPAVFEWDPGAESGTLDIELSPAQTAEVGVGQWTGIVKILGPGESLVPRHDPRTMSCGVVISRWPEVVP